MAAKDAVVNRAGLPVFVLGQVLLGTAARHRAIGSIYHNMRISDYHSVVLWVALGILLHYANIRELRTASVVMVCITLCRFSSELPRT